MDQQGYDFRFVPLADIPSRATDYTVGAIGCATKRADHHVREEVGGLL
jgi:hypothetical protein